MPTEEERFDLQTGTDEKILSAEEQHFFDITGYIYLPRVLNPEQVKKASQGLDQITRSPLPMIRLEYHGDTEVELINIIEAGGVIEDAMALRPLVHYLQALIWGQQFRLIASRGWIRKPGSYSQLTQGGQADPRRYTRYRCGPTGEFRCLLVTCMIPLSDSAEEDGCFCLIPGSHKSNLAHPYNNKKLKDIPSLHDLPMTSGSAIIFTENVSHAMKSPRSVTQRWLEFQYGPSYMVNWPGCNASSALLNRTASNAMKSHLLQAPYYHPSGSQQKSRLKPSIKRNRN